MVAISLIYSKCWVNVSDFILSGGKNAKGILERERGLQGHKSVAD